MKKAILVVLSLVSLSACHMGKHYANMRIGGSTEIVQDDLSTNAPESNVHVEVLVVEQVDKTTTDAGELSPAEEHLQFHQSKTTDVRAKVVEDYKTEIIEDSLQLDTVVDPNEEFALRPLEEAFSFAAMNAATAFFGLLTMAYTDFIWIFFPMAIFAYPIGTLVGFIMILTLVSRLSKYHLMRKHRKHVLLVTLLYVVSTLIVAMLLISMFL